MVLIENQLYKEKIHELMGKFERVEKSRETYITRMQEDLAV